MASLSDHPDVKKRLKLKIPGSTSNLGPGLDTLGLALQVYNYLTIDILDRSGLREPMVSVSGSGAASSRESDQTNMVYRVVKSLWHGDKELLSRLRISVESEVPLGCGLGSTSAAILGGLWASFALQDLVPTRGDILARAAKIGGHLEFLAASLLGGMVVCSPPDGDGLVTVQRLAWPDRWRLIVAVPGNRFTSEESRSVLAKQVPLEDAIYNVQRSSLLVAAVSNQDEQALRKALSDRLHEPYRSQLIPALSSLKESLSDLPILGCVLSGGGPAVVVFVSQRNEPSVASAIDHWATEQPEPPQILHLKVDSEGVQELT